MKCQECEEQYDPTELRNWIAGGPQGWSWCCPHAPAPPGTVVLLGSSDCARRFAFRHPRFLKVILELLRDEGRC